MKKKELIYPFLLECKNFTPDLYWKNVFEDLAYGVTPYGTFISKDHLSCKYKDKEFSFKLQEKNAEDNFKEIFHILKFKLGLLSREDILQKKLDSNKLAEERADILKTDWSLIKRKNIKDVLIEHFVLSMKKKYKLTLNQARYLMSIIFIGMTFKVITNTDIHFEQGQIQSINGISFSTGKLFFEKDMYDMTIIEMPEIVIEKTLLSDYWRKYLLKFNTTSA